MAPAPAPLPPAPALSVEPPAAQPAPSYTPQAAFAAPQPPYTPPAIPHEGAVTAPNEEARELANALVERGMSPRMAEDLIADARMHDLPFAGSGGVRAALRSCLMRCMPRHRGLPRGGALVAVVGAGGSGKTRCAAALTASYRGVSALHVRAVVLGRYNSGAELSELLDPHGVPVQTAERGSRVAGEIAASREGELIVADTPTVSPADPAGVGILAVELQALTPEEVLVTLPATINLPAARQMLRALAPLGPTGIVVTHADETDQLGIAAEVSLETGLPLVFIHQGLDLERALSPADPATITERLLA
ncbi:MAG TPA: hypothetical protein VL977_08370, partial [Solirubrobacteraceae bacterium]|nr:hypothetical protein [Solirubrobacteraceae bacterium]